MIIIRDYFDIDTLRRRILDGDILEIYNVHYDTSKYYWVYKDIMMVAYGVDGNDADYCWVSEFHRDIRMALLEPSRYFIKLVTDTNVEVVRADEEINI